MLAEVDQTVLGLGTSWYCYKVYNWAWLRNIKVDG